ncbi:probable ubiquitin conjugation factor E4 [Papaver somniferum]|nr:probable ubiquitin conjugation factor E4 [Papaver somniferum]
MSNSSEEATSSGNNMGLVSMLSKTNSTALPCGKTIYTFGCEFFFMTARVLHLGLIKSLSELQRLHQKLGLNKTALSIINVLVGQAPFPQPEKDMELLHKELEILFEGNRKLKLDWRNFCCYLSQILQDKALLQEALSFYRLMVVWLVDLVGGFKMPLPLSCPIEFACVPEHFVEDAIEMLIVVFTYSELLNDIIPEMDEFMKFIIMFIASSNYIRNSYIRQRMVELLGLCISNRRCSSSVITIFEGNQLCVEYLVRNLLALYVSKEFTGSPNQVQFRRSIMQILAYLWEIPSHRNAWRQIAEEDTGFYVVFLNSVISKNIQLLDNNINRILQATDEEVSSTRALYIQLEKDMNTVVMMLNYFLLHLVSLYVKSFGPRQPNEGGYHLKILLKEIVRIYVHLARGDKENIFPAAISKDSQSNCKQLFIDVAEILQEDCFVEEFIELGTRVNFATLNAIETEASLGEIPNDFLDPIEFKLMEDPVVLPSTKTVDRSVIQRHLLNYDTDPFNGLPLTQEMIIPNLELKAKIVKFTNS